MGCASITNCSAAQICIFNFRPRHDTFFDDAAAALLLRISYFLCLNCFHVAEMCVIYFCGENGEARGRL